MLLDAREALETAHDVPADRKRLALEEILIAEGSDWNWWYGPEHETANAIEFDQIYREHLANVYRSLGLATPPALSHPILQIQREETQLAPTGPISPTVNGVIDSYFEWLGAGVYRVDHRSGAMHGKRMLVKEVYYGGNDTAVFLKVDFAEDPAGIENLEVKAEMADSAGKPNWKLKVTLKPGIVLVEGKGQAAFRDVLEVSLPASGGVAGVRLSFWQDGLPVQAIPPQDYLHIPAPSAWNA